MTEEEIILQGKSKLWIKTFEEAKKSTGLTAKAAEFMSLTDVMEYMGEHKQYNEPVKQIPLIDEKTEVENAIKDIDANVKTVDDLRKVWDKYPKLHRNQEFINYKNLIKAQLQEPELDF